MLRKDREVKDFNEIYAILERCDTLRVAFSGADYPYIVPLSFGLRRDGERIFLYFHGAKRGLKTQKIEESPSVCFEGDIYYKTEQTAMGITARYESVIGRGTISTAEGDEVLTGLTAICAHYGFADYPVDRCKGLPVTAVYKIEVTELTGKRNLPEDRGPAR